MTNAPLSKTWPPHISVAAVIERQGKFLIVEENVEGYIVFNQPAGHLELDESLIAATIRETLEETGWRYQPAYIIGIYFYTSPHGITYQRVCFTGQCELQESPSPLDPTIIRTHWLTRDEISAKEPQLRSPMVLRCIDDYLEKKRFPLNLITDLRNP